MYGIQELKTSTSAEGLVECPVRGCKMQVPRMRKGGLNLSNKKSDLSEYYCDKHKIYISPTTFEYESELDNILWKDDLDLNLWQSIKTAKRESRIARENSEDALTWNVFRYLEKADLLDEYLSSISNESQTNSVPVYWSHDSETGKTWEPLYRAREEFGEVPSQGSEPDLIVQTDSTVFFIEAKFGASNRTPGSKKEVLQKISNPKKYESGGSGWYDDIFNSSYEYIVSDHKYELLRFWLLGSWIAAILNKKYVLCNLVLSRSEQTITKDFGKHLYEDEGKVFIRSTWEDIYRQISSRSTDPADVRMLNYFKHKTLGYKIVAGEAKIRKAFSI